MLTPNALRAAFDDSYRLTHLLSRFLTIAPDAIGQGMIDDMCGGTMCGEGMDKAEAFAYLLTALFDLDIDSPDERRFFRHFLLPSVKKLDPNRYRNDDYFRKVVFPSAKKGNWDLKTITYPAYRAFVCDDPLLREDYSEIQRLGFFDEDYAFPAVLENDNEWMTLTPVDMDTCQTAIARAHGKVATFGLGLGYFAFHVLQKTEVTSLTVIEHSPDVIALFEEFLLPQFPSREKLRILPGDAFAYMENEAPKEEFDFLFIDTWRDAGDGLEHYLRYKPLEKYSPKTEFAYWIEDTILSRYRAGVFEENWILYSLGKITFTALMQSLDTESLRARARNI